MHRAISSRALQVPVSPPTFDRGKLRHCLSRLNLADVFIQALTASAAHPSPVTDENDAPEQVALDHQGVEAGHVLLRLNPPQNEGVLDGRTLIHSSAVYPQGQGQPAHPSSSRRTMAQCR